MVSTCGPNATIQSSLVNVGVLSHPTTGAQVLAFVTYGRVKLGNLRARPQVTSTFRAWQWATVEGRAELAGPDDPQPWLDPSGSGCCSGRSSPRRAAPTTTGTLRPDDGRATPHRRLISPTRIYSN